MASALPNQVPSEIDRAGRAAMLSRTDGLAAMIKLRNRMPGRQPIAAATRTDISVGGSAVGRSSGGRNRRLKRTVTAPDGSAARLAQSWVLRTASSSTNDQAKAMGKTGKSTAARTRCDDVLKLLVAPADRTTLAGISATSQIRRRFVIRCCIPFLPE